MKLSQQELANQIGITRNMLLSYENSHVEPKLSLLLKFSTFFQIRVSSLLTTIITDENYEAMMDFYKVTYESINKRIDTDSLDRVVIDEFINEFNRLSLLYDGLKALLLYKEESGALDGNAKDLMLLIERLIKTNKTFLGNTFAKK